MKKFLLAAVMVVVGANVNAQQVMRSNGNEPAPMPKPSYKTMNHYAVPGGTANKGTGLSNPFTLLTDSMAGGSFRALRADFAAPIDSGYFYGTNAYGYKGFAYLYNLTADATGNNDTSITVLGFISRWVGRIQPNSTKTVTFSVWGRGTDKTLRAGHTRYYLYGKPSTLLASQNVKDTTLRTNGNFTYTPLATPLANQNSSVYVGYTVQYNWSSMAADTFGLGCTAAGYPATDYNYYNIVSGDTLLDVNNMIQNSNGAWFSPVYEGNSGGIGDMVIAPVVSLSCPTCAPTSVNGVRANNLTFFGNYPNPANNATNIRFSLDKAATVSVSLLDNTGRLVNVVNAGQLNNGEHIVSLDLNNVAAGTYIYVLETSTDGRIASQLTVTK